MRNCSNDSDLLSVCKSLVSWNAEVWLLLSLPSYVLFGLNNNDAIIHKLKKKRQWNVLGHILLGDQMNLVSDFNSFKLDKSKIELNTNSIFETDLKRNDSILTSSGLDERKVGQVELIYTTRK